MTDDSRFWNRDEASAKDTWQTPQDIVQTLQDHVDIRLDPCAGLFTFIGQENWTIETTDEYPDGLGTWEQPDEGSRVFYNEGHSGDSRLVTGIDSLERGWDVGGGIAYINPPFSLKEEFIQKTIEERSKGNIDGAIVLTPDSTDVQSWWHSGIRPHCETVWFSKGRISFVNPETGEPEENPTFGTALHFTGDADWWPDSLFDELSERGEVLVNHVSD